MKMFEIQNAIAAAIARNADAKEIEDLQAQLDAEEARLNDEYAVEQVRHVVRQHFKATTSTAYERSKGLNHRNKKGNNKWAA